MMVSARIKQKLDQLANAEATAAQCQKLLDLLSASNSVSVKLVVSGEEFEVGTAEFTKFVSSYLQSTTARMNEAKKIGEILESALDKAFKGK